MEKYKIKLEPSDGNLGRVREIADERLSREAEEVQERVEIDYSSFPIGDYGVNTLADNDHSSFVDLLAPSGESLLPRSDIALRIVASGTEHFVGWCLERIQAHKEELDAA
jgi:hypothetical protein